MRPRRARSANTIDAYDVAAGDWDRGLGFRSPRFARRMRTLIVRLLQPAPGHGLALDLGAGTGWMLDATAPLFDQLRAIEPNVRMREACGRRIADLKLDTVHAESGDAMSLVEIGDASADAVYAVGLLDAVPEPARVFSACQRVLKPGGVLVVSTSNGACPWYALRDRLFGQRAVRTGRYLTPTELVSFARDAGLREIEVVTWGMAPPSLISEPLLTGLDRLERIVTGLGLSGRLGVLTASFRKPTRP